MAAETEGAIRRSLVDATADAFARRSTSAPAVPAVASDAAVTNPDFPVIRRSLNLRSRPVVQRDDVASSTAEQSFDVSRMRARDFQRLVDAVVEALEQRVIDELERRGRRNPGVF